jgi:hypothetical protein
MVGQVSGSASPASPAGLQHQTSLDQIAATAHLARETNLVVHVIVPRAAGVVEHGRMLATELGLECYADVRGRSIRIRFTP